MATEVEVDDFRHVYIPWPIFGNTKLGASVGDIDPRYWATFHKGVDLLVPEGTPVYAVMDGVVQITGYDIRFGNRIWILCDQLDYGRVRFGYCHLVGSIVEFGAQVKVGQLLGYSGATGKRLDETNVPPHLHFQSEVYPSREILRPFFDGDPLPER